MRKVRTDEELREMAGHVLYEIDEFHKAIRATESLKKTDDAWNRTLEAALLHFRNLRGFFVVPPENDDDVSALDYIAAWSAVPDKIFIDTRTALNKKLAHLTWRRVPWTAGNWNLATMKTEIDRLFEDFKRSQPTTYLQWFSPSTLTVARGMLDADGYSTVSVSRIYLNITEPNR